MTVYAHNNENLVIKGDKVQKGEKIATVGNTGNSTGPHLHFEVRLEGRAMNPREFLP
jgi:murein DD-endopeptidase MepM/ murein hydrolase activator NlpD